MSTEHQDYSTENQLDTIRRYAEQRGFEIIQVYEDSGRSGLTIGGRDGLQSLMREVQSQQAAFKAILVYDVSRWGRFQDADEGAYHEHLCSRAGIRVHYCGEQFDNDGSIGSILLKNVKRVMAGEYSRELSVKVFAGQCRLVEYGFRQGGPAGYGLRRLLLDQSRTPKGELVAGDRKSLQTDRVVLTLGPSDEIEQVNRIYSLFVHAAMSEREIASLLNNEGRTTDLGTAWSRASVHQILTNEKYIGNNVFNRVSYKLKQRRVVNHPDTWVRADGAFPAVVDLALFARARAIIDQRSRCFSDDELLSLLRQVLAEEGALSGLAIDERDNIPSSSTYRYRFGSLVRAYQLIGYEPERDYQYIEVNRALRQLQPAILSDIAAGLRRAGALVTSDPVTDLLTVNEEFTASLIVSRSMRRPSGSLRWHMRFDTGLAPDITIAVRMDDANAAALDYYLFPSIDLSVDRLRLQEDNPLALDAYRFETLDFFLFDGRTRSFHGGRRMTDMTQNMNGKTVNGRPIQTIPIDRIRLLNPRARNRHNFQEIVRSIAAIGLKRPITVSPRRCDDDDADYDLICGQGRIEAFKQLGQNDIPAIVTEADESNCLVMSLVENCARRQHRALELLEDISTLRGRGYSDREIAGKIGVSTEYVHSIASLLAEGEERLVAAVEKGILPLNMAIEIAKSNDGDVQQALTQAYTEKKLRGRKLVAVRRLLEQRQRRGKQLRSSSFGRRDKSKRPLTSEAVIRVYRQEADRQKLLIAKAEVTQHRLLFVVEAIRSLRGDHNFTNLLRAEKLDSMPAFLQSRLVVEQHV